jgi:hypothetical protein
MENSGLVFAAGSGGGNFATSQSKSLGGTWAATGEVTGDSRPDVVIAAYDKIYVVPGSTNVFGTETPTTVTYNSYYSITTGDLSGDGKGDVLLGSQDALLVMTSNGGGALATATTQTGGNGIPAVGDFNHDGKPDVAQVSGYYVYLRLSGPSGALGAATQIYSGADGVRAAATDLDGDGFSDLVIASNGTWNDEIIVMRSSCK